MLAQAQRYTFPKQFKLLKRSQYLFVQGKPQKLYCRDFLMLLRPNEMDYSRFGLVVSKKVDKRAVIRNKIKRCLREVLRLHQARIHTGFDFVIIARKNATLCSFIEIEEQILNALDKGKLLSNS